MTRHRLLERGLIDHEQLRALAIDLDTNGESCTLFDLRRSGESLDDRSVQLSRGHVEQVADSTEVDTEDGCVELVRPTGGSQECPIPTKADEEVRCDLVERISLAEHR